eukprot:SAG31_NODE_1257_length_9081_cov_7.585838_8_plen_55_part_00
MYHTPSTERPPSNLTVYAFYRRSQALSTKQSAKALGVTIGKRTQNRTDASERHC